MATVVIIFVVSIGLHISSLSMFVNGVMAFSEHDNKVDKAARIILCVWWVLSFAGFIVYILDYTRGGRQRLGYSLLNTMHPAGLVCMWYCVNYVVVMMVYVIKVVGLVIEATVGNPARLNGIEASHEMPKGRG